MLFLIAMSTLNLVTGRGRCGKDVRELVSDDMRHTFLMELFRRHWLEYVHKLTWTSATASAHINGCSVPSNISGKRVQGESINRSRARSSIQFLLVTLAPIYGNIRRRGPVRNWADRKMNYRCTVSSTQIELEWFHMCMPEQTWTKRIRMLAVACCISWRLWRSARKSESWLAWVGLPLGDSDPVHVQY